MQISQLDLERHCINAILHADIENRKHQDITMIRDFFLGFVKIHILHHAEQEPVYGLALIEELRRHGYTLSPGTLYPILHQLDAKATCCPKSR